MEISFQELLEFVSGKSAAPLTRNSLIGHYCIVRTYSAGVFAGVLKQRDGKEAVVTDARRLWYWKGAASLSELSRRGVKYPEECKFPMAVPEVHLTEVIEILPCSDQARESITGVAEWQEH